MNFLKSLFFLVIGSILLVGSIFLFFTKPAEREIIQENQIAAAVIGETRIEVEVADTPEARNRGLSGREGLPEGSGMLFFFENPSVQGFWMKDMNFAIDIIWINENLVVTGIENGVSPDTYPEIFRSNGPVKYVLEVPAGFSEANGIAIGAEVHFEYKN